MTQSNTRDTEKKKVDIYRDTPVRLLGYANEVGESFRVWVSRHWVRVSYAVSFAYVLADTADKTSKQMATDQACGGSYCDASGGSRRDSGDGGAIGGVSRAAIVTACDTLLWQTLASVVVPGLAINRLCALTWYTLGRRYGAQLSQVRRKRLTTAAGLLSIPFIVRPIDHTVDWCMDMSVRRWMQPYSPPPPPPSTTTITPPSTTTITPAPTT